GGRGPGSAVTHPVGSAESSSMIVQSTAFAAARSRAHGPTAALWHAVELHRSPSEVDGACELTLCGSLARVSTEELWPVPARDVCPACAVLARG
ncbi:MAG: hypothetical protein ACJ71Y_15230, partial [Blastococcus sp.]